MFNYFLLALIEITVIHRNLDASAVIQGLVKGTVDSRGCRTTPDEWLLLPVKHSVASLADRSISTGLMIDPRTKALVLNGKPGHLQFYSLQGDKQLYNVRF